MTIRPKFRQETAKMLREKFAAELKKARPALYDDTIQDEAELFVGILESHAELKPLSKPKEKHQRRRERLEYFANCLDKLVDAGLAMDDPALGYAMWRGMMEAAKLPEYSDADRASLKSAEGMKSTLLAYELQTLHKDELAAFTLGVRKAIADLPELDDFYYDQTRQLAYWLEDWLCRRGIAFSTSDTGLTGTAYLATVDLMGLPANSAKYKLTQAVNSPNSWTNFSERMRQKLN